MSHFALFDLDHTLLLGDSDHAWGEYMASHQLVEQDFFREKNEAFYQQYVNGTLDIYEYYNFALQPLIKNDINIMLNAREKFLIEIIAPMIPQQSLQLVQKHQEQGDTCIIITATQSFVTQPIASLFAVEHLLATDPEIIDGKFTGNIAGTPCFQKGKLTKFRDWLKVQNIEFDSIEHITAYSDSYNDLPLLQMAHTPVAVNPDQRLASHATEQGWQIIHMSH